MDIYKLPKMSIFCHSFSWNNTPPHHHRYEALPAFAIISGALTAAGLALKGIHYFFNDAVRFGALGRVGERLWAVVVVCDGLIDPATSFPIVHWGKGKGDI